MFLSRSILTNFSCSKIKQQKILETDSLQVGYDALGGLQDSSVVGLPICHRAILRNAVPHQIQICLREMGLHQSHRVLYGIPGRSLYDGLQSATGRL